MTALVLPTSEISCSLDPSTVYITLRTTCCVPERPRVFYLVRLEVSPETRTPVLRVLVHLCTIVSEGSTIDDQRWGTQFV